MPLIAAGIVPHSPLLLQTVGKEYSQQTRKTKRSLTDLCNDLLAMQPDVVCVIHPHGTTTPDRFLMETGDAPASLDLSEFGDMVTATSWQLATTAAQSVARVVGSQQFPYSLTTTSTISYDVGVPLEFFPKPYATFKVLPITIAPSIDRMTHVNLGALLAEAFHDTKLRIAALASAELSSHASAAATGGMRPEGERYDQFIQSSFKRDDRVRRLLSLDDGTIELAESCGFLPLLVLSGILKRKKVAMVRRSYEHPFGIGFLVASLVNV